LPELRPQQHEMMAVTPRKYDLLLEAGHAMRVFQTQFGPSSNTG
jgi:hypothetical protein